MGRIVLLSCGAPKVEISVKYSNVKIEKVWFETDKVSLMCEADGLGDYNIKVGIETEN